MLHLNIRSLQKNFNGLFNLLMTLKSEFQVIFIIETWCSGNSVNHDIFKTPQCKSNQQVRRTGKAGGTVVFLHESLSFNIRHDLSVNNANINTIINRQEISMNLRHI